MMNKEEMIPGKKFPPAQGGLPPQMPESETPAVDAMENRTVTTEDPTYQKLAQAGRFGDTEMAHTTPGEVIIPLDIQDEELMAFLQKKFGQYGIPMDRYTVQDESGGGNPETGENEYFSFGSIIKSLVPAAASMIPGVGAIAGPVAGALMSGMGGSSSGGGGSMAAGGYSSPNALADLPSAVQSEVMAPKKNPFRDTTQLTVSDETMTPNTFKTPPLSQDADSNAVNPATGMREYAGSCNPGTGMKEYFSFAPKNTDLKIKPSEGGVFGNPQRPTGTPPSLSNVIGNSLRGNSGQRGNIPPMARTKGNNAGIPPMRGTPSMNPRTNRPEFAGVAASSPVTVPGFRGQAAPVLSGTYDNNYVKTGAVDLTPFSNSGTPRVRGVNASTYAATIPPEAPATTPETPAVKQETTATGTQTNSTPAATSPYVDEQYFGEGRNQREKDIQGLGYSGPFGKGVADAWLSNKYGTTNLDQVPRASTQTTTNNQQQTPDPFQGSMDKLNALISQYLNLSAPKTETPTTTSQAVQPQSSLSPYRPPRLRSRRYRSTLAANF